MAVSTTIRARLTGRHRGVRQAAVVAALAAAMIAGSVVPAHASTWAMTDNFESNPASRWTPHASANGGGHFSNNSGWAHSGSRYAYRWVVTGYSSVRRDVHLAPVPLHPDAQCGARIYVQAVNVPAVVLFEVINPVSWTAIALRQVALNPGGYHQVTTPAWDANRADVVVRVAALGYGSVSDIRIDDLRVNCWFT